MVNVHNVAGMTEYNKNLSFTSLNSCVQNMQEGCTILGNHEELTFLWALKAVQ